MFQQWMNDTDIHCVTCIEWTEYIQCIGTLSTFENEYSYNMGNKLIILLEYQYIYIAYIFYTNDNTKIWCVTYVAHLNNNE